MDKRCSYIFGWMLVAALGYFGGAGISRGADALVNEPATARVVVVHDALATDAFRPRSDRVRELVSRGLTRLTGKPTVQAAWMSLITTQDVVGIKVNAAAGLAGTRPEVAAALAESLLAAGLKPNQVVIWDRLSADLLSAGFNEVGKQLGVRVLSAHQAGYDESVAYTNFALGHLAWTDHEFNRTGEEVGKRSFSTRLITKEITKIVNVPSLLNHYRAGVSGCLYTLALGSVDNIQRFESSPERLADVIPELYAQENVLDKVVLNVVDALIAQYQGESQPLLHYATALNELRFSRDPLALDVLSLKELAGLREFHQITSSTNVTTLVDRLYRENAPLLQLGVADLKRIQTDRN
jgi:hypothetical protein